MRNKRDKKQRPLKFKEVTPLCPNCLKEVDPKAYYCPYCNSPSVINPNATYMPYESIKFETDPIARILPIYGILVLLMFCTLYTWLSLVIVPLCIRWIIKNPRLQTKLNFILLAFMGTILAFMIFVKIIWGGFFDPFFKGPYIAFKTLAYWRSVIVGFLLLGVGTAASLLKHRLRN